MPVAIRPRQTPRSIRAVADAIVKQGFPARFDVAIPAVSG